MKVGFSGHHDLRSIGGGFQYVLTTFGYTSIDGLRYDCPAGSITDGASTKFFFGHINIFPTPAQNCPPSTLHDRHYKTAAVWRGANRVRPITRKESDHVFKEGLQLQNLYLAAWYGYIGLRLFGWRAWNRYRKEERLNIELRTQLPAIPSPVQSKPESSVHQSSEPQPPSDGTDRTNQPPGT